MTLIDCCRTTTELGKVEPLNFDATIAGLRLIEVFLRRLSSRTGSYWLSRFTTLYEERWPYDGQLHLPRQRRYFLGCSYCFMFFGKPIHLNNGSFTTLFWVNCTFQFYKLKALIAWLYIPNFKFGVSIVLLPCS